MDNSKLIIEELLEDEQEQQHYANGCWGIDDDIPC